MNEEVNPCLRMRGEGSKAGARTKESHFIGRLVGVNLPKTADYWLSQLSG